MMTTTNVVKHEYIGKEIEIVAASNASLVSLKGTVVDETRNTFVINTVNGEKTVLKQDIVIKINVQGEDLIVEGKILVGQPEDRLKK